MNYRVKAQGTSVIKAAMYADDLALIGKTSGELQKLVDSLHESCCKWGTKISIKKTKVLSIGYEQAHILLDSSVLENVTEFTYLGSIMSQDGGCIAEIDARISKASKVYGSWKKRVFTNRQFSISTKMKIFRALVRPVLLYGCETWSVTQPNLQRLNTFHMRCIRSILGVSRWNKIKNSDNLERACEDPIDMTIQKRLQWLGHLLRMNDNRPQKQLLRSRLSNATRPTHGPKQRWIDVVTRDLRSLHISLRDADDRAAWRSAITLRCQNP